MITIGFDPGLDGAMAFINDDLQCQVDDLPTLKLPGNGKVKRTIDGSTLRLLLRNRIPPGAKAFAFVEQQVPMGGKNNALQTQGSVMRTMGTLEGVLGAMNIRFQLVSPQTWKRLYGLGSDKKAAIATAQRLYPDAPLTLAKHHNRADSLLIAHYGMRKQS
jgi:hypothetical protein